MYSGSEITPSSSVSSLVIDDDEALWSCGNLAVPTQAWAATIAREISNGRWRRIDRLAAGNPGDIKAVGEGVSELRIDHGPGYRVYFQRQGRTVILLLAGGDKRTQKTDIEVARRLARSL